jgi:hypothetical protein
MLTQYERGLITSQTAIGLLAQLECLPDAIATDVPTEFLSELQDLSRNPPSAETVIVIGPGSARHYADGLRRWQDYFALIDCSSTAPPGLG